MRQTEVGWLSFGSTEPAGEKELWTSCLKHLHLLLVVRIVLSKHPGRQMLVIGFGTYAGKLSFFPLSTTGGNEALLNPHMYPVLGN